MPDSDLNHVLKSVEEDEKNQSDTEGINDRLIQVYRGTLDENQSVS